MANKTIKRTSVKKKRGGRELKPEYAHLTRIQFFKSADYYGISDIYEDIYLKSTKGINVKNLIPLIKDKRNMLVAIRCIKANKGANTAGIDGITFTELLRNNSIDELHTQVCELIDDYKSSGVRRVYIPKSNGKLRPLGIPNAIDKLIQQMIKQVMEPYCEGKFFRHSYGFRPTRGIGEVIARCHHLVINSRCTYCVDVDIKGFFDNVHHNKLIKQIWNLGIKDKQLLMLIKKIIKAPVDGVIPTKGTPQGGILSPLLSNIVLNELDQWVASQWEDFQGHCDSNKAKTEFFKELQYKKKIPNPDYIPNKKVKGNPKYIRKWKTLKTGYIVRYADDFKIFTQNYAESIRWFYGVKQFLDKRLHLETSEEKSKIVNLKRAKSNFLGFELKAINTKQKFKERRTNVKNKSDKEKYKLQVRLSKEKLNEMTRVGKELLNELIHDGKNRPTIIKQYNVTIVGWQNYCQMGTYPSDDMNQLQRRLGGKLKRLHTFHGKLKPIPIQQAIEISELLHKRYKDYNGLTHISSEGLVLCPIWAIKQKKLAQRNPNISPYVRKDLVEHWYLELGWDNSEGMEIIDNYCDNKWVNALVSVHALSLYTSQYGGCPITNLPLQEGFEIHHKLARSEGGNDSYHNLVMLNPLAHKLIHSVKEETYRKYIQLIKNDGGCINKAYTNKLRNKLNLQSITVTP